MTCQGCAITIERALERVQGVSEARVNYGSKTATIGFDSAIVGEPAIGAAIRSAGYRVPEAASSGARTLAEDVEFLERGAEREQRDNRVGFFVSLAFGATAIIAHRDGEHLFALVATAVVVFIGGRRILASGLGAGRRLSPDMNTMVALGMLAAFRRRPRRPVSTRALRSRRRVDARRRHDRGAGPLGSCPRRPRTNAIRRRRARTARPLSPEGSHPSTRRRTRGSPG